MPARVTITAFVVIFPLLISTAWAVELAFGWGDMEGGKGRQQGCGAVCWWRWLETAATCSAWAEPGQRPAVRGPGLQLRRPRTATEGPGDTEPPGSGGDADLPPALSVALGRGAWCSPRSLNANLSRQAAPLGSQPVPPSWHPTPVPAVS